MSPSVASILFSLTAKLQSPSSDGSVIGDATLATEGQAPFLHAPAAHVENVWNDRVLVHPVRVIVVERHVEILLFMLGWLVDGGLYLQANVSSVPRRDRGAGSSQFGLYLGNRRSEFNREVLSKGDFWSIYLSQIKTWDVGRLSRMPSIYVRGGFAGQKWRWAVASGQSSKPRFAGVASSDSLVRDSAIGASH